MTERMNEQYAPYPEDLEDLVEQLRYRPGWTFALDSFERDPASSHGSAAGGLTFVVTTWGYNSYHPERGEGYRVNHYFPVPAATYNRQSWQRWLFDQLLKVEQHECMEFFALQPTCDCYPEKSEDGEHLATCSSRQIEHPYAATHGPGDDPYVVHEYASDTQRRTQFTGTLA